MKVMMTTVGAVGLLAFTLWTLPLSFVMFYAIDKTLGLRVPPEVEAAGIDLAYHGIQSYPEFNGPDLRRTPAMDLEPPGSGGPEGEDGRPVTVPGS